MPRLRRPLAFVLLVSIGALAAWPSSVPAAESAGLRFLGCVTGKLPVSRTPRRARPGWCVPTRTAVLDAEGSGLDHVQALAASPDGRSIYAVSSREDSVSTFSARPLRMRECISGNAHLRRHGRQPCKLFPHAGTEDALTGFNGVHFVTVSPDGRSVYTTSEDGSIGILARNRTTGALTFKGCITGAKGANSTGKTGVCTAIATATRSFDGFNSGLSDPASLTVSPDGRFAYVAARGDAAIATLARGADGSLSFRGCLTGGSAAFTSGSHTVCTQIVDSAGNPAAAILRSVNRIAISPDGTSLYATTPKSSSLAEFRRDPASGALAYAGCLTALVGNNAGISAGCTPIPTAVEAAFESGMYLIDRLAMSRDGRSLYAVAHGDDAVDSFSRDPATGALTYLGCVTGDSTLAAERGIPNPCTQAPGAQPRGEGSGLNEPGDLALDPSGRRVYVAAPGDSAIATLTRNAATGALAFSGCLSASHRAARPSGACTLAPGAGGAHQLGFGGLSSLAIAGKGLYATASAQSAISRFALGG